MALKMLLCLAMLVTVCAPAVAQEEIVKSYLQSGIYALNDGQYAKGETLFRAALSEIEQTSFKSETKTSMLIVSLNGLGMALINQQKYAEAEAVTRRLITVMEQANRIGAESDYPIALNNLGLILSEQRKFDEASEIHRRVLSIREKHLGSAHPDVAISLLNLGKVYFDSEKFVQAEAVLERAISILTAIPTKDQTDANMIALATCDMNLSSIKVRQRKFDEAEKLLLFALTIRAGIQGPSHPDLIETLRNYAILLRQTNRQREAANVETRIRLIQAENP